MRRRIMAVPVALALVAIPGVVAAQVCVGTPVAESRNAITAELGFPQDANSFGAAFRHNLNGPASVSASYALSSYDGVDPKQHAFGVEGDYALPVDLPVEVCPTLGLNYARMAGDGVTISSLTVPVGVALGRSFVVSPTVTVIPHLVPQWIWMQARIESDGFEFEGDDSFLGAQLGATVDMARFYFGGRMMWLDQDDVDPVFSIIAGMPF